MATVNVNGADIYYRMEGSGEKVAMTHGAWTDAETWQVVTALLADRYQIVVWDRRGHSRSQAGTRDGYRQDARDLVALLEALGGEPAHLVGNSSGGAVVLNATAFRPDLVRTAAVHEPAVMGLVQVEDELSRAERATEARVKQLILRGQPREAARHFIEELGIGLPGWEALPVELRDTMTRNASTVPLDIDEGYQVEAVDWAGLARAGVPVLVSYGTDTPPLRRRRVPAKARRAEGPAMRRFDVARVLGEAAALLLFAASAIAYPLWGRRVLIAAVGFGLAGSVLGLVPAVIVVGPHTTPDLVYHLLLVTAFTVGLYPAVTGRKTQRDRSWCVSR